MGYNATERTLVRPINVADISSCLSHPSRDVGALCRSPRINEWAKYKPISGLDVVTPLTEEQRRMHNYGMPFVPYFTSIDIMTAAVLGNDYSLAANAPRAFYAAPWQYVRPSGSGKYRILDFDGYDHRAEPFTDMAHALYEEISLVEDPTFCLPVYNINPRSLGFGDLAAVRSDGSLAGATPYIGMVVGRMDNRHSAAHTWGPVSSMAQYDHEDMWIQGAFEMERTYVSVIPVYMYAFLSSIPVGGSYSGADGIFIPIPMTKNVEDMTFETVNPNIQFDDVVPWQGVDEITYTIHVVPNATYPGVFDLPGTKFDDELWLHVGFTVTLMHEYRPDNTVKTFDITVTTDRPSRQCVVRYGFAGETEMGSFTVPMIDDCTAYWGNDASGLTAADLRCEAGDDRVGRVTITTSSNGM